MAKRGTWGLPAEIASSVNEDLIERYRNRIATTSTERKSSLMEILDRSHGSFFGWARTARFLRDTLQRIEGGSPVDARDLSQRRLANLREFYGHSQGVTYIDRKWDTGWVFSEGLFDYPFTFYRYAPSTVAGSLIGARVAAGDGEFRDRYIDYLKAGASAPPMKLIERLGIDLTSNEPYDLYMKDFEQRLKEAEAMQLQ